LKRVKTLRDGIEVSDLLLGYAKPENLKLVFEMSEAEFQKAAMDAGVKLEECEKSFAVDNLDIYLEYRINEGSRNPPQVKIHD